MVDSTFSRYLLLTVFAGYLGAVFQLKVPVDVNAIPLMLILLFTLYVLIKSYLKRLFTLSMYIQLVFIAIYYKIILTPIISDQLKSVIIIAVITLLVLLIIYRLAVYFPEAKYEAFKYLTVVVILNAISLLLLLFQDYSATLKVTTTMTGLIALLGYHLKDVVDEKYLRRDTVKFSYVQKVILNYTLIFSFILILKYF